MTIPGGKAHHLVRRRLEAASDEVARLCETLRARPEDIAGAIALARSHAGLGWFSRALEVLRSSREVNGQGATLCSEGAALLSDMGFFSEALGWLAQAIALRPEDAAALLRRHRVALAAMAEDSRHGISPQGKTLYLQAMELLARGRFAEAEIRFGKVTRHCPGYVPGWLGWRGALEAQSKTEALAPFERAWRTFSPRTQWAMAPVMSRRLSPRGLLFDPREPVPIRPRGEALKAVDTCSDLQAGGDVILSLDAGGETIELAPVIPLASAPAPKTQFRYVTAPKHLAAIEGAALVGRGLVLNRFGEAPEELKPTCHPGKTGMQEDGGRIAVDPLKFHDGLCPIEVHETPALLLAGPTDSGFGDWTLNFPPRLAIAAAAGLDCPIVVRAGRPETWLKMLEAAGAPRSRIILHDPRGVSVFTRLYVPSWPLPLRTRPMRGLFDVYRRESGAVEAGKGERLYLSREGVGARSLVNEPEIRAAFERRGFKTIRPERLSFERARALFSRASMIGGAYGSAFLNLPAHASRPRAVLALMPPSDRGFLDEIALWIGASGNRFAYLTGDSVEAPAEAWSLPVERVEAALDELLQAAQKDA